jgi:predicted metal-dependent hydrolase
MTSVHEQQLELWGNVAPGESWSVRESARARRLTVRVFRTGRVEVVVPPRTSRRLLQRFIHEHRGWIEAKRAAARADARPLEPFPPHSIRLAATGEELRVEFGTAVAARARARRQPGAVLRLLGTGGERASIERALRGWLVAESRSHLGARLDEIAGEFGFRYERLAIRRQRTRWGSCSTRGTISLNCCLMFQRPEVVRYLLIHELSHTRHMNHSSRFWGTVAGCCPDYESLDAELLEGWRQVPGWVFGGE